MSRLHVFPVASLASLVALGAAGAFGVSPVAQAATLTVANCNDTGAGSLRAAVGSAVSGDTIDLRSLTCKRIVLTSGAIMIPQTSLSIRGPGYARFAISGNYHSSVFRHTGTGTLGLRGIAIEQGEHRAIDAEGGCIYSAGNVDGNDIHVRHCAAYAVHGAIGGGIYAAGNITLFYSAVYSNGAKGASSGGGGVTLGTVQPGGILTGGNLRAHRTRFLDNAAASGGAIRALGDVNITYSTIANNRARFSSGAMDVFGHSTGTPSRIAYSTISGNTAVNSVGTFNLPPNTSIEDTTISGNRAPFISIGTLGGGSTIANSTITDNRTQAVFESNCFPGALVIFVGEIHIESSIIAQNLCNGVPSFDITGTGPSGRDPPPDPTSIGADNLIGRFAFITVPADTITAVDPHLGPLADNGGRTLTHLPAADSMALNRGNNVAGFDFDQRGEGFPRTKGTRTDIGAVER
jgi:hypothetical protein